MNTTIAKLLSAAALLAAAVLVGFQLGQKNVASHASVDSAHTDPVAEKIERVPAPPNGDAPASTSPVPVALSAAAKPPPEAEASPANLPTKALDPDALPAQVQALVDAHEEFRDWLERHPDRSQTEALNWLKAVPPGEWNLSNLLT